MGEPAVLERSVGLSSSEPALPWFVANEAFPAANEAAHLKACSALGHLALATSVEMLAEVPVVETEVNNSTLVATIQRAALGDSEAKESLKTNVAKDMSERVFKAGNQTKVEVLFTDGKLSQNDLLLTDIYQNGLKHTELNEEMTTRSRAEVTNAFLFEELANAGILKDHYAVLFSLAPEDEQTRKEYNFYEDTLTCSIQLLSLKDTKGIIKTALVAGKKTPHHERHDIAVVNRLISRHSGSYSAVNAAKSVQKVMLVNKAALPNDIDDLIRMYDDEAGGTFYGEAKPRQDYGAYGEYCEQRNAGFSKQVEAVTEQLIREAGTFRIPIDANRRLDELSEAACVSRAGRDLTIQAKVFGEQAAWRIEQARHYWQHGDQLRANRLLMEATKLADSGSCPIKLTKSDVGELDMVESEDNTDTHEDCEFISKECPSCGEKNVPTVSKKDASGKTRYYGHGKKCRCVSK